MATLAEYTLLLKTRVFGSSEFAELGIFYFLRFFSALCLKSLEMYVRTFFKPVPSILSHLFHSLPAKVLRNDHGLCWRFPYLSSRFYAQQATNIVNPIDGDAENLEVLNTDLDDAGGEPDALSAKDTDFGEPMLWDRRVPRSLRKFSVFCLCCSKRFLVI